MRTSIPFLTFVILAVSSPVFSAPIQEFQDPTNTATSDISVPTVESPGFSGPPPKLGPGIALPPKHLDFPKLHLGPGIALPPKHTLPKLHLGPGLEVPPKGPGIVNPTFTPVSSTSSSASSPAATPDLGGNSDDGLSGGGGGSSFDVTTRELIQREPFSFGSKNKPPKVPSTPKPPSSRPGLFSSLLPFATSFIPGFGGSVPSTSTDPGTSGTDPSTNTDTAAAATAASTDTAAAPVGTDVSPADNSVQPLQA